jgi:hypothetical protein
VRPTSPRSARGRKDSHAHTALNGYRLSTSRQRDAAETLALQALAWLAASDDELTRFAEASGVGAEELRARAAEADVLRAVLDFVLADDARLLSFCASHDVEPKDVHMARHALDGAS